LNRAATSGFKVTAFSAASFSASPVCAEAGAAVSASNRALKVNGAVIRIVVMERVKQI